MTHKTGCIVCGEELIYFDSQRLMACAVCGKTGHADASCTQGHYVCNACHSGSANDWIEGYCQHSPETDPVRLATTLMRSPKVKMHGPEHHYLTPAVLLTAYYNQLGMNGEKETKLRQARERAETVIGGFCGFCGTCGAAVGTGIFISLITGATPLSVKGWQQANLMSAQSLGKIAHHGGPRCCKRDTFLALQSAQAFLAQHFGVILPLDEPVVCQFSEFNKECLRAACPFYAQ